MSLPVVISLIVAVALLALLIVVAVLVLRDPQATRRRVEGFFRRAPKPAKAPGQGHYYRPYWS
jgi:hypothetical protein